MVLTCVLEIPREPLEVRDQVQMERPTAMLLTDSHAARNGAKPDKVSAGVAVVICKGAATHPTQAVALELLVSTDPPQLRKKQTSRRRLPIQRAAYIMLHENLVTS